MARKVSILSSVTRHSSRVSTPLAYSRHKFDLMVFEQRKLVEHAQDSLQQSLSLLHNATSKEEYDSERLQVQSLISRSEELVLSLQVINELRIEITYVLKDITDAKRNCKEASSLYKRLQWLEQHLESLLLSRKRGRPGIRSRREHHQGTIGLFRCQHGHRNTSSQRIKRLYQKSSLKSVDDSVDTVSRDGTISLSIQESNTGSDIQGKDELLVSKTLPQIQSQSLSSKPSPSQDSDIWHSESEANWTMVENPFKDLTQSQVLSEDEPKQFEGDSLHTSYATPVSQCAKKDAMKKECYTDHDYVAYGFEPPRSTDVFGDCSWNFLCLAVSSKGFQEREDANEDSTTERIGLAVTMLNAGLTGICEEISSLNRLVQAAVVAATNPGPLLSVENGVRLRQSTGTFVQRSRSKTAYHEKEKESDTCSSSKLPSLDFSKVDINIENNFHRSRKVYGSKICRSHSFPRSSSEWQKQVISEHPHRASNTGENIRNKQLQDNVFKKCENEVGIRTPLRNRTPWKGYQRKASQSSRCYCAPHSVDGIFDKIEHQKKHTEHLSKLLESSVMEIRRDTVQAISILPSQTISESMKDKLHGMFLKDADITVRYTAMKALLAHGIIDEITIQAVCCYLKQGSFDLKLDLLRFLQQDSITTHLTQVIKCGHFHSVLADFLSNENTTVSFEVAVLLSKLGVVQEGCLEQLQRALHEPSPATQSLALTCLVNYCACYNNDTISSAIEQMYKSADWKMRLAAIEALKKIGHSLLSWRNSDEESGIFKILLKRLIDEPVAAVRLAIGQLLMHLKLEKRAKTTLLLNLESSNPIIRAEAASALAALNLKSSKIIQLLLDSLELDPSIYVRVQVVRMLGQSKELNFDVMKRLREKSKGSGIVAQECKAACQSLSKRFKFFYEDFRSTN